MKEVIMQMPSFFVDYPKVPIYIADLVRCNECKHWCKDNSYGRPCVRALNAMCREKRITIDYDNYDFSEVW